ncbi:MAG: ATP-binding protein [Desulfobulbaceae bacterium]|nr:ATP-binding protein [Desulfobulbaceae bacterium]
MKVIRLHIQNVRCFVNEDLSLSPTINVIVGPNNNGKTTLLNCVSVLQQSRHFGDHYRRINTNVGSVRIWVDQADARGVDSQSNNYFMRTNMTDLHRQKDEDLIENSWPGFPNSEPGNYIIPYQSKRKVGGYNEGINVGIVSEVTGTLSNLYAKIDRISNPEFQPAYDEYVKACDEILGFRVSTTSSRNGKKATYIIRNEQNIPIDMMGEGISNLLGLIVDLCRVENKLFVIEEPENDIHPRALKKLLDLIVQKSNSNQFIVTTHSNIVLKHLGAAKGSRLFNIEMSLVDKVPTSSVHLLDSVEKRRAVLEDLGYEPFDYELWNYWIFFEEASAERIFRDFLIPWFAPQLKNRVRTFSARSISQITLKFEDFNRLFVFLNLEPMYRNRVWVVVDGGEAERKVITELAEKYVPSGWDATHFRQFSKHNFEEYYPDRFSNEATEAICETEKARKMELKRLLLEKVILFCAKEEETAKIEFRKSSGELIDLLMLVGAYDR